MDESIRRRTLLLADYIIRRRATVRQAAAHFGLPKSSVHKDVGVRLREIDLTRAEKVAAILRYNKAVRHIRGGESTRRRYEARRIAFSAER